LPTTAFSDNPPRPAVAHPEIREFITAFRPASAKFGPRRRPGPIMSEIAEQAKAGSPASRSASKITNTNRRARGGSKSCGAYVASRAFA
jgi:hypothetical protein